MSKRYYLQIKGQVPVDVTGLKTIIVGRDILNCNFFIDNPQVSRRQCLIDIQREPFIVTDGDGLRKRSKNGTKVNNKILYGDSNKESEKTCTLKNNDVIYIGKIQIKFIIKKTDIQSDVNVTLT